MGIALLCRAGEPVQRGGLVLLDIFAGKIQLAQRIHGAGVSAFGRLGEMVNRSRYILLHDAALKEQLAKGIGGVGVALIREAKQQRRRVTNAILC